MRPSTPKMIFNPRAVDQLKVLNRPGQSDIVAELISDFLDHLPGRVGELQKAVAAGVTADVVRLSHALKSAAGVLGLEVLETVCRDIETNPSQGSSTLSSLRDHLSAAQKALREYAGQ